jgi:UDP-N-acetylglucosamine 2-epimerase (non-hydrolysing)
MKHVLLIFGTRPEAIKMVPVYLELASREADFNVEICVTAQHREMLDQVLDFFSIRPKYDLDLMRPNQNLYTLTSDIVLGLKGVFDDFRPEIVLVHGDTTTSIAGALAAFYYGAKVGHVEAGLRTYDKLAPFPEEINRQLTSRVADYHFAPTAKAKDNLLNEAVGPQHIEVTGNTVVDALFGALERVKNHTSSVTSEVASELVKYKRLILVTGHRRENHGDGIISICNGLKRIAETSKNSLIIYPVHLNPNVQNPVNDLLGDVSNICLINPVSYPDFVWLMEKSYLIITDSGGVQEEAPSLGKPVLVLRDVTERPEAVLAGTVKLVGTNEELIYSETIKLIDNSDYYRSMSDAHNPYGDGKASWRIANFLSEQ